jgi:hypothetical protein
MKLKEPIPAVITVASILCVAVAGIHITPVGIGGYMARHAVSGPC